MNKASLQATLSREIDRACAHRLMTQLSQLFFPPLGGPVFAGPESIPCSPAKRQNRSLPITGQPQQCILLIRDLVKASPFPLQAEAQGPPQLVSEGHLHARKRMTGASAFQYFHQRTHAHVGALRTLKGADLKCSANASPLNT